MSLKAGVYLYRRVIQLAKKITDKEGRNYIKEIFKNGKQKICQNMQLNSQNSN